MVKKKGKKLGGAFNTPKGKNTWGSHAPYNLKKYIYD